MQINHEFIAIGFPGEGRAMQVAQTLARAEEQELVKIDDATIVVRAKDGTVIVDPYGELMSESLVGGSLTGMLAGALLATPIAGALIGGAAGATIAGLTEAGIEEDYAKAVGDMLQPGTSALFVLVNRASGDRGIATLKKYEGKVLRTTLPDWKEEKLRRMLEG